MARRNLRRRIEALVEQFTPELRAAFLESVQDLRDNAEVGRIAAMLERGDIEAALHAVHLDPAAFRTFERAVIEAYNSGGAAAADGLPHLRDPSGGRIVVRFDARNPRAEAWVGEHSSRLVTAIVEDQRQAIRTALQAGVERGVNPRATALDIVGRVNRATGRREGGIIGLTEQQSGYVQAARDELLSGDAEALRNYLSRARRDQRFDRTVKRALAEGQPLSRADVDRITARYSDRLLQLRGEMVARTEAMTAVHAAQDEALHQALEAGGLQRQHVRRIWRTASDARVRDTHAAMNGQAVGLDEPFVTPSGARMMYPGDSSLGAPAAELVQCRCSVETRYDFLAEIA